MDVDGFPARTTQNDMYELIGGSKWAEQIRRSIERVAGYRCNILIEGPSGTGKELIASAIHRFSGRVKEPFVAVDCTSIPSTLFPSQLFGHVKGAFSGAEHDTLGSFRAADGGTIFLDEIGELSLELQCQLLRVVQQRAVVPVGSHKSIPVDVRVLAATNLQLEKEVQAGRFRLDLFYRLNVVKLTTTALNERVEDISPLCEHFLNCFCIENGLPRKYLSRSAVGFLESCQWPGNVRQLQNVLERAVVFSEDDEITDRHLMDLVEPEETRSILDAQNNDECPVQSALPLTLDFVGPQKPPCCQCGASWPKLSECERRLIRETLEKTHYNQSAAARLLGIDRRLLLRKIEKLGILLPFSRNRAA
ncbi:MAG: sigma-54 dependent transcriptional regulator [Thermoguttaceae bacterium]|jgi:DNA-binding NtrC family response regulator